MLNTTSSERLHIAFFGCRNAGKSSLVNAITNQQLSVVSDIKGTTTDPVKKAMEILPIGPVVIIDTAGLDDKGKLGELRISKTLEILDKTDIAVLVVDSTVGVSKYDKKIIKLFKEKKLPFVIVYNKSDLINKPNPPLEGGVNILHNNISLNPPLEGGEIAVSSLTGDGINELRELLGKIASRNKVEKYVIKDKLKAGDIVILVIPIDEAAPKGRIILPQQNVLREILDAHTTAICIQPEELEETLKIVSPKLVITDSQVFNNIKTLVPKTIMLTSFSILMANYRGELKSLVDNAKIISELQDGDKVLISEACTHHRQCNDIGTVKFPKWIKDFTKKSINFEFTQGGEFPQDLGTYKLILHCGGCMINEAEMKTRQHRAAEQKVPMINYGTAIAYMNGILDRALEIFKDNRFE